MIGLVIVTHSRLAEEFRVALEHIVGPQEQLATLCIEPEDEPEGRRDEILSLIREVDTGEGAVLMTDMFGGTPSNLAISVLEEANVEVVAGVNLPMLIKFASIRGEAQMADAVNEALEAGRKYITAASQILAGQQ